MGASEWRYFAPYHPDITDVLKNLQQAVFEQDGEALRVEPYWQDMSFEEFLPPDPDLTDEDREEYRAEWDRLQALSEPTTIDELREWNGAEGTSSILDIEAVSETPEFGTVSPLTPEQLEALFGTTQPTRAMVEQGHYHQLRERGSGLYIVVYHDRGPHEVFFTGRSGD